MDDEKDFNATTDYGSRTNITSQLIASRLDSIHEDMSDLRGSLKENLRDLAKAINKLVALETNQTAMTQSYDRLVKQLDKSEAKFDELEERIDKVEKDLSPVKTLSDWAYKGLFAVIAVVAAFVLKFVGLY